MPDSYKKFVVAFTLVWILSAIGCYSSDVAPVEGTVTINGQPIDRAMVNFYPTEGRASGGYTDANGFYSLSYTADRSGAMIGNHRVTVTTKIRTEVILEARNENEDSAIGTKITRKEMLPKKYSDPRDTELTATVESGSNVIDFDLVTK